MSLAVQLLLSIRSFALLFNLIATASKLVSLCIKRKIKEIWLLIWGSGTY